MKKFNVRQLGHELESLKTLLYNEYTSVDVTLDEAYSFLSKSSKLIRKINKEHKEIVNLDTSTIEDLPVNYKIENLSSLSRMLKQIREYERDFEGLMLDKQNFANEEFMSAYKKRVDAITARNNHLHYYSLWEKIRVQSPYVAKRYMELRQREEELSNEYIKIADSIDQTTYSYHIDTALTEEYIQAKIDLGGKLREDIVDLFDYIDEKGQEVWSMLETRFQIRRTNLGSLPTVDEYITYINWKYRYGILNEVSILAIGAGITSDSYKRIIEWMHKSPQVEKEVISNPLYS